MKRKDFGSILDETVSQMERDVRALKNQRVTLGENIKDLEKTRQRLSDEIVDLEVKHKSDMDKYKNEIDLMMKKAKDKLGNATLKESDANTKLLDLNEKIKESDNLIKSNEGSKNTLEIQTKDVNSRIEKLVNLAGIIGEVLKNIK